jgi:hypothetical protein
LKIEVARKGTKPLAADYDAGSSPAQYYDGVCSLHRSMEWKMMLTHEQLHETITAGGLEGTLILK